MLFHTFQLPLYIIYKNIFQNFVKLIYKNDNIYYYNYEVKANIPKPA